MMTPADPAQLPEAALRGQLRFSLVCVRENAEGIALYRGEEREAEVLNQRFADVFTNGWRVLFTQAQLVLYQVAYGQIAHHLPLYCDGARLFAGALTLGVVMQTASAFGQVQRRLSFFIDNYTYLAELRAVMDRLKGLQTASTPSPLPPSTVGAGAGRSDLGAAGLTLACPMAGRCSRTRPSPCRGAARR